MNVIGFIVLLIVVAFAAFWCAIPVMVAREAKQAVKSGDNSKLIACVIVAVLLLWIVIKSL